jgi:hypothetical protein
MDAGCWENFVGRNQFGQLGIDGGVIINSIEESTS